MFDVNFWKNKRVFVTGHTGFKGSWLCLWLNRLGARVAGYALAPQTEPSLFKETRIGELVSSTIADIRDLEALQAALAEARPEIVIHMAAQSLVRDSYRIPVETYGVNVMGTVNLLEAVRGCPSVRAVVNVTTDKCYENREWLWGYRENEPMGGYDPYSSSKACSELVTAAYRSSFFNTQQFPHVTPQQGATVATARAGNVIGGGDWSLDRLIPDCIRAILAGEPVAIRNPHAIRPWQHVLEPLSGYLLLAQRLCEEGAAFASAWNFGPLDEDARQVGWVVERLCASWGGGASFRLDNGEHPHEEHHLKLDCSKARAELGWRPRWTLEKALDLVVDWTRACREGKDLREVCLRQIGEYERSEG